MIPRLPRAAAPLVAALAALAPSAGAAPPQSRPERPRPTVVENVTVQRIGSAGESVVRTIVLRDGRIEAVQDPTLPVPAGARRIDGQGLFALPAFLDAFSSAGCETPEPIAQRDDPIDESTGVFTDMREANRKGIQPSFRAAQVFALPDEVGEKYRKAGFGALLAAPRGELLAGRSALATTRQAAARSAIVRGDVHHHASFGARGGGYPGTLMAYHAQLRQFFLDAQHHRELEERYAAGRPGPRPAWDPELAAARRVAGGEELVVCEAESARDVRRWVRLADELGLRIAISGGRDAWKVADLLAERGIPVFLTLDWGEEVDDPREKKKERGRGRRAKEGEEGPDEEGLDEELEDPKTDEPDRVEDVDEEAAPEAPPQEPREPDEPAPSDPVDPADPEHPADPEQPQDPQDPPDPQEPRDPEQDPPASEEAQDEEAPSAEEKEPEEKDPWIYEEPFGVRLAKRLEWEERRDGAKKLHDAGVALAFCSGDGDAAKLLERVRTLVEHGFPADAALVALTSTPAELLGVGRRLGYVQRGHDATFALWTAAPTEEQAEVAWIFVDGFAHEHELKEKEEAEAPDPNVEPGGHWSIEITSGEQRPPIHAHLEMEEEGEVSGELELVLPVPEGAEVRAPAEGRLAGARLTLEATVRYQETDIRLTLEATIEGDRLEGTLTVVLPDATETVTVKGSRLPDEWFADSDCCTPRSAR